MRLIDADELKKDIMSYKTMPEIRKAICEVVDDAPTIEPKNKLALDLIDNLKNRSVINNKERGILRRAILLNENTKPQGDVNNAIKTIKAVCEDNNICTTCPMNGNCNEQPAKWEEVQE